MNPKLLQQFKERLLEEKQDLLDLVASFEKQGIRENLNDTTGELSAYDNHPADYVSQLAARQTDYGLLELTLKQLTAVNHALERMQHGKYGICENCQQPIDVQRLQALPYASQCLSCKEELEQRESSDAINQNLSFDRSFRDGQAYTGFDGEDAWQAVARWGTANGPQDIIDAVTYDDTYLDADELIGSVTELETITAASRKFDPGERMD